MALASDEIMITEYLASFIVDLTSGIYEDTSDLVGTILNIAGANLKVAGIVDIGLDEIEDLDELKQPNSYNNSYNKLEGIVQSQEMIYASPQILEYLDLLSLKVTGQYDMAFSFSLMPISALDEDEINFSAGKNYDNFSDEDFVAEYYLYAFYNSFFSAISTEVGSKVDEEIKDAFDSLYEGEKDTDEYNQALRMFSAANFDTFYEQLAQEFIDDNYDGRISQISGFNPGRS